MSDVRILSGNQPTDVLVMVSADQDTIVGNGTTADPLRAASGLTGFRFDALVSNHAPVLGYAVSAAPELDGDTRVTPGDGRAVGGPGKQICGIIVELDPPDADARIQCGGLVTLTTDEWDAVIAGGGGGGLQPGEPYYLAVPPQQSGDIRTTRPPTSGTFFVLVGVAVNSTTLLTAGVPIVFQNP